MTYFIEEVACPFGSYQGDNQRQTEGNILCGFHYDDS